MYRKRKPLDCGKPRCGICHFEKYHSRQAVHYGRHNRRRKLIGAEAKADGLTI